MQIDYSAREVSHQKKRRVRDLIAEPEADRYSKTTPEIRGNCTVHCTTHRGLQVDTLRQVGR